MALLEVARKIDADDTKRKQDIDTGVSLAELSKPKYK